MTNWRPKGKAWVRNRNDYLNRNTMLALSVENIKTYEVGADAMWEAMTQTSHCHVCMGELVATERAERLYCPRCRIYQTRHLEKE